MSASLVGSEMCIRDRCCMVLRVQGRWPEGGVQSVLPPTCAHHSGGPVGWPQPPNGGVCGHA
eukprot:11281713-Alexandrium_andersonii.AAC.1